MNSEEEERGEQELWKCSTHLSPFFHMLPLLLYFSALFPSSFPSFRALKQTGDRCQKPTKPRPMKTILGGLMDWLAPKSISVLAMLPVGVPSTVTAQSLLHGSAAAPAPACADANVS